MTPATAAAGSIHTAAAVRADMLGLVHRYVVGPLHGPRLCHCKPALAANLLTASLPNLALAVADTICIATAERLGDCFGVYTRRLAKQRAHQMDPDMIVCVCA